MVNARSLILLGACLSAFACSDDDTPSNSGSPDGGVDATESSNETSSESSGPAASATSGSSETSRGSSTNSETLSEADPMLAEPSEDAEAVIDALEGYRSWGQFPGHAERVESGTQFPGLAHAPSGTPMWVETFRNDVVARAASDGEMTLPPGSLIVKENYPSEEAESPMALTVMYKTETDDWFWIQMTPDGKIMRGPDGDPMEGDVAMCSGCHSAAEHDFSFYFHPESGDAGMAPMPADGSSDADVAMDPAEPSEQAAEILQKAASYRDWSAFPGHEGRFESGTEFPGLAHAPSGSPMWVQTYRNDVVAEAQSQGTSSLPAESLIVKENYMDDSADMPMALTIMYKAETQEWFWIQATPDGKIMRGPGGEPMEGDVAMCSGCHGAASNDSVFLFEPAAASDGG